MSTEAEPRVGTARARRDERAPLVDRLLDLIDERVEDGRATLVKEFARAYVRQATRARFHGVAPDELLAQVLGLFELVDERRPGELALRVENPERLRDGWQAPGTVVEANVEDAPFLIDTVQEELHRHGLRARLVMHPVCDIERDERGRVASVGVARVDSGNPESVMHFELDHRLDADGCRELEADLRRVLGDARLAVQDFPAMVERVGGMLAAARAAGARYGAEEIDETVAFLEWLTDESFVFLGYREYEVRPVDGRLSVAVVPGSGLGVLRKPGSSHFAEPVPLDRLPRALCERITGGALLTVSKTNREATVHRRAKMDYVGVKRVDDAGAIIGELRLIGLFTTKTYAEPAAGMPVLRRKLQQIVEAEELFPGSHDYKAVVALFESFPKDDLFATPVDELRARLMSLLELQERRAVRLFVRPDPLGRSVSALVALPTDHVSDELRARLQELLRRRYDATSVDHHLWVGEAEPARFHFTVHVPEGRVPQVDPDELEAEIVELARSWDDRLESGLIERYGELRGRELAARYGSLFPEYYKSATAVEVALADVGEFQQLDGEGSYRVALANERGVPEPLSRLKLYKTGGKVALTELLPILEELGLTVVEEVPTRLREDDGEGYYLHDFGVLGPDGAELDLGSVGELVADTVRAVWDWRAESDSLNRLVVAAGLGWRQVAILRAYRQYRQVLGVGFTTRYQNDAFVRNAAVARKLVELFEARFDPAGGEAAQATCRRLEAEILADLDAVASLDDDRILRAFLGMVRATVRTNAFVDGGGLPYLSFKLRSAEVPAMPKPVPMWEIFVYSPEMEGVHLRGGPVARGGIRWSDRLEDYRTEVLGLMKAQMVKNALIVPVGAKGGFVLKYPPLDREELLEEERRQYVVFMRGLLDLTDNIVGGKVVPPRDVRVLDARDAYLVVAADKGTAHLSDTANEVSEGYGYWLGDAFASGGSSGYDHKALGITAKGVWESVKRHFREMGRDVMEEPFSAAGIGDMSGDVFGNGMLLSPHTRLVAAFDHRHVFLDPDPDPARSLAERRRLFELPRSSWDDYDRDAISEGGGVWPRSAKKIPLSEAARSALGVEASSLSPNELVSAILRAPVDLFWNGGIGTFVKASSESNADVGDRGNDAVRIDASELRAHVVAEGGNLGFTQLARIEYASQGGRINTDAIDNSAGVDCSDHEVNLKILLGMAVADGRLDRAERDRLLEQVASHVVVHVLYDNYLQVQILSQEMEAAPARMEAYEDLMEQLEEAGLLERAIEFLPGAEQMAERRRGGQGMARPELCVLLAYAKRLLRQQLERSSLLDDPALGDDVASYFPGPVVERFGDLLERHPLRRELAATIVTNDIVNAMGLTFVQRMSADTGAGADEVVRAFLVARRVSAARSRWDDVERLDGDVEPSVQSQLMARIDSMVEQLTRWYLLHVPDLDIGAEVEQSRAGFAELAEHLETAVASRRPERLLEVEEWQRRGVPAEIARCVAIVPELVYAPDIIAVARAAGRAIADVAAVFSAVGERLYLDTIEQRVAELPGKTRWQRLAWRTLVDDLRLLRRQIAERVIAQAGGDDAEQAVDRYLRGRVDPYQRLAKLMETISGEGIDDASVAMVAVHQIRQVVSA